MGSWRNFGKEPFGSRGPSFTDIGIAAAAVTATVLTGGGALLAAGIGAAAGGSSFLFERQKEAQRNAIRDYNEQMAAYNEEIELPSFDFTMPEAPPVPEMPKPPAPVPSSKDAADRAEGEARIAKLRRRTLSLFASSRGMEGQQSTILTSGLGVTGAAPVRRRELGAASILGGGVS